MHTEQMGREVVQIILVRRDGALILQQRDNKPGITNPGLVAAFGGAIEEGEEPIDAAVREVNEETNLGLQKTDLHFFKQYTKTKQQHGEDMEVHYFIAEGVDEVDLEIYEGQGYRILHSQEGVENLPITPLFKRVLQDYYAKRHETTSF